MAEFEFNSTIVRYALPLAEKNGFEVILTQPLDGKDTRLDYRIEIAIKNKVNALVSIHADYNNDRSVRGFWNFYWFECEKSKKLANIWIKYAKNMLNTICRGSIESKPYTWTNFYMVRNPIANIHHNFPAILCECGFMSNTYDLSLLLSDNYRKLVAEVIVRSLCEFFGKEYKEDDTSLIWKKELGLETLDNLYKSGIINTPEIHKKDIENNWFIFVIADSLNKKIDKINDKLDKISKILNG